MKAIKPVFAFCGRNLFSIMLLVYCVALNVALLETQDSVWYAVNEVWDLEERQNDAALQIADRLTEHDEFFHTIQEKLNNENSGREQIAAALEKAARDLRQGETIRFSSLGGYQNTVRWQPKTLLPEVD